MSLLLLTLASLFLPAIATSTSYTPHRYNVAHGNSPTAHTAWKKSLAWREENSIYNILSLPNPKFDKIKLFCPHFFAGRDAVDNVIFVQCPGRFNVNKILEANLTIADLLFHYVYTIEYCWNVLDSRPSPKGVMTSIIDLKGLRWSNVFSGEQMVSSLLCASAE